MLQAMRQNTKIILWITVFFFVLLIFLVWGADLQFGSGPQPGTVGSVNGETIPVAAYQTLLAQQRQVASARGQDLQPTDHLIIEEQAWNSIVDEILLGQEAERRGLTARDDEVRAVLLNNPPPAVRSVPQFLNSQGQFDLNIYRQVVTSASTPESFKLQLEGIVRATLPLEKMQNLMVSGARVTEQEVRDAFRDQNEAAKVSYILVPPGDATQTELSEEQLLAHYEKTQDAYAVPRRADLMYITVPRTATAEDTLGIRRELQEFAREARLAESSEDEVRYSDFATLALTFSDGPNAEQGGLSAGYLTPEEMSPAFRRALQNLESGEISAPFKDGQFMHIVRVEDVKDQDGEPTMQVRDLAMRIQPSDSTIVASREALDAVREQGAVEGLEAAAAAHGFEVRRVSDIHPGGIVPGLSAIPGVAEYALSSAPGTLSRVFETNGGWYLVEVQAIKEPGQLEFAAVRQAVEADLRREMRLEQSRARADALAGEVKLGKGLAEVARANNLSVQDSVHVTRNMGVTGLGREPEVLAAVFALPEGQVSSPLKTQRGWVVLKVDRRVPPNEELYPQQAPVIRQSLMNLRQEMLYNAYMTDLRKKAKIEDFRT